MLNKHKQKQIKDGDAQFLYYTNTPQRYHQTQFNKIKKITQMQP